MANEVKIVPSCMEIKVCGKLVAVETIKGKNENFYANTIIIPAPDSYSNPKKVVINSRLPFASEGEIVDTVAYVNPQWRSSKEGKWFFGCNLWREKPSK